MTAYTRNVGLSPALPPRPGDGAPSASGEILHGVTFGYDLYERDHRVLVHELGHVMGLPDLYPTSPGNAAEPAARPPPARTWSGTGT